MNKHNIDMIYRADSIFIITKEISAGFIQHLKGYHYHPLCSKELSWCIWLAGGDFDY